MTEEKLKTLNLMGKSNREISRLTGIDRCTVKYRLGKCSGWGESASS